MNNKHCNTRMAHHSDKEKNDLNNRLKRIEGQIRGINKMIQDDIYCDDILNQISSVQAALSSTRNILLEAHINSCIKESIEEGNQEAVTELMNTLKKMLK